MNNISILITASAIYTGRELIRDGYIYIEDGIIKEMGPQPAPDELQDATLIIGGEGRVVVPGLTAIADVAAYPIRFRSHGISERIKFYRGLSDHDLFTLSLPGIYELHMMGVTTAFVEALSPALPLELARRIGGFYGAARPSCAEEYRVQPILRGVITIGGEGCPGGEVKDGDTHNLVLTNRDTYSLDGVGDVLEASQRLRRMAGLGDLIIEPGATAELAVYDTSRPPAMLLYSADEYEVRKIYTLHANLESLIAGADILVEMGEHLRIGRKHLTEALQTLRKIEMGKEASNL